LGKPRPGGITELTLFLEEINTGTWPSRLGERVSKIEAIKYARDSRGTQTRESLHWRCPATTENYRHDLSSERSPHINKPETVYKYLKKEGEKLVAGPRWCLAPRQTG
jgi:hypothetical protein